MDGGARWAAVHGSLRVGHNWATSLSLFTCMHWRRKWQPTPVFLPGESQGRGSLVGCRLWGRRVGHDWSDLVAAAACPYDATSVFTNNLMTGEIVYIIKLSENWTQNWNNSMILFVEKIHKEKSKNFCLKVVDWTCISTPITLQKKKKAINTQTRMRKWNTF